MPCSGLTLRHSHIFAEEAFAIDTRRELVGAEDHERDRVGDGEVVCERLADATDTLRTECANRGIAQPSIPLPSALRSAVLLPEAAPGDRRLTEALQSSE